MNILGVIPARGGSKSVPRKNIALVHGKPLIAYTIEAAQHSRLLTHFLVSSDDPEIIAVARKYGAPVPFVRPAELATDIAPTLPVVQHAVGEMERMHGITYDFVVLLQPTTPLRLPEDIDAALEKLVATGANSVISVCDVGAYHPARMRRSRTTGWSSCRCASQKKWPAARTCRRYISATGRSTPSSATWSCCKTPCPAASAARTSCPRSAR